MDYIRGNPLAKHKHVPSPAVDASPTASSMARWRAMWWAIGRALSVSWVSVAAAVTEISSLRTSCESNRQRCESEMKHQPQFSVQA